MITGWGHHHVDIAHWGMNAEYSGPVEIKAAAEFPNQACGTCTEIQRRTIYRRRRKDVDQRIFPNGIRFEGSEGWIFVTRGDYSVTASDPTDGNDIQSPLSASDPSILKSQIGPDEIHLYRSSDHHGNWLECIRSRQPTILYRRGRPSRVHCVPLEPHRDEAPAYALLGPPSASAVQKR